ncbi:MAG: hypothetical protein JWQ00_478, partial [Noviherbaspirillum sp.]|nr:hypothetical protein [Noviherbaspirillum sp.]
RFATSSRFHLPTIGTSGPSRHTTAVMLKFYRSPLLASLCVAALILSACNPTYNWREVRGPDAPYLIMLPGKAASASRAVTLNGAQLTMTMTASEVQGTTFAVGSAQLPDATQARAALDAMKNIMVNNIGGTIRQEKRSGPADAPEEIAIEAVGTPGASARSKPRLLFARFIARDKRVYQVIVVGPEEATSREAVDTFLTSFKPA